MPAVRFKPKEVIQSRQSRDEFPLPMGFYITLVGWQRERCAKTPRLRLTEMNWLDTRSDQRTDRLFKWDAPTSDARLNVTLWPGCAGGRGRGSPPYPTNARL